MCSETYGEHNKVENGVVNIREKRIGDNLDSMARINADLILDGRHRHIRPASPQHINHHHRFKRLRTMRNGNQNLKRTNETVISYGIDKHLKKSITDLLTLLAGEAIVAETEKDREVRLEVERWSLVLENRVAVIGFIQ